jgi:uncharacterized membrane protein
MATRPSLSSRSLPGHLMSFNVMPSAESSMQFTVVAQLPRSRRGTMMGTRLCPRRRLRPTSFVVVAFLVLGTTARGGEPRELPTLPSYLRAATRDLNDRGQVVGVASGESGAARQAVLWSRRPWKPGSAQPLPVLPGMFHGEASAISRNGIPVGVSSLGSAARATLWKKGPGGDWEPIDLEPPPGLTIALATGVNSRGTVVGWAANPNEVVGGDIVQRAVLWRRQPGGGYLPVELETPDGFQSRGAAINERGDVVGTVLRTEVEDGVSFLRSDIIVWRRPFGRHGGDERTPIVLTPLPGLPTTQAPAINLLGDVVAYAQVRNGPVTTTRPLLWKRHRLGRPRRAYGDPIELPVPEGFTDAWATDINFCGRIVGTAFVWEGLTLVSSRGVVWTRGRRGHWRVQELDAPEDGSLIFAVRLNNLGWVVGNDLTSVDGTGALLWKPSRKGAFHPRSSGAE